MYLNSVILSETAFYCWCLKPQGNPTLQPALRGTEIHEDFNAGHTWETWVWCSVPCACLVPCTAKLSSVTSTIHHYQQLSSTLLMCPLHSVCVYSPKMQPRARIVPQCVPQCVQALLWMRDGRVVPLFFQVLRTFQQALSGRCGEVKVLAKTNSRMSCTISQCLWLVGCLFKCQLFLQNGNNKVLSRKHPNAFSFWPLWNLLKSSRWKTENSPGLSVCIFWYFRTAEG